MAESQAQKPSDVEDLWSDRRKELLSVLKNVVNRPECSDVVFRCNDGICVYGSRWLLASRCEVFKGMLSNGMLESNLSEIVLPKFASPVILSIVEYLYIGAVESNCPLSWKMGFELISAAQFFIIPAVEEYAQNFLRSRFGTNTQKSILTDMLSIAVEFEEDWKDRNTMLQDLISYIGPYWCDEDCCRKLSRKAVEYILSNSERNRHTGEHELSVEEYLALRRIVLWHVYQALPMCTAETITTLQYILPGEDSPSVWRRMPNIDIDGCLSDILTSVESCDTSTMLNRLLEANICKDSLAQMILRHINLSLIPASLLLKVIHPLKIVPSRQLLKALVHIAVHRCSMDRIHWKHGPSLKRGRDGQIRCESKQKNGRGGVGIAVISSPRSSDIHEWSFRILEDNAGYIELGFVCEPAGKVVGEDKEEASLADNLWHWSSARVLCVNRFDHQTFVSRDEPEMFSNGWECFQTDLKANSVVNFQVNASEKTCRVSFGNSLEAVWTGLPDGDCHPAVGFNKCQCASVELTLAGGFE